MTAAVKSNIRRERYAKAMTAADEPRVAITHSGQFAESPKTPESSPPKNSSQPNPENVPSKWAFRFARTETNAAARKRAAQASALARTSPGWPLLCNSCGSRVERPRQAAKEDSP